MRTGVVIGIGNCLTVLFRVVALRIYTHLLSAPAFGAANLVLGVLALGSQLLIQPTLSTQLRFHTEAARAGNGDGFTVQVLRWSFVGAAIVAAIFVLGFALWPSDGVASTGLAMTVAAVCWIFASTARSVFYSRLHAEQRMQSYIWLRVAEGGVIAIVTSLALLVSPGAEAFVWGQVTAFAIVLFATSRLAPWPTLRAFGHLAEPDRGTPRFLPNLRRYGAPFVPMAGLQWLANMGDRYVLAAVLGAGAAGQYLAAFTIASNGFIIANGVMGDLFRPKLFDAETAGAHDRAHRIFLAWLGAYVAISLCGFAIIAIFGDWIVWLLLAEPYRAGAVEIMLWIAFGYGLNGLSAAFENRLYSLGRSASLLPPLAFGGICSVAFSLILVPWHGIVGAAQASALSFAVQLLVTGFMLRRALKERAGRTAA